MRSSQHKLLNLVCDVIQQQLTLQSHIGGPSLRRGQQQQHQQHVAEGAAAVKRKVRQIPVVAGIVKATPWDPNADVSISIFPKCAAHAHLPAASCGQV